MAVLDRADALLPILEISVYFRAIRIDPAATVRSEYGHTTKPTTLSLFDEADLPGSGRWAADGHSGGRWAVDGHIGWRWAVGGGRS